MSRASQKRTKTIRAIVAVGLWAFGVLTNAALVLGQYDDHWGLKEATPAVVHPAAVSSEQRILSLRGEWDFATDPMLMGRHRMGKGPGWNEPDWSGLRKINVPGCWEAQGVGEPGTSSTWDCPFDCCPRPLAHIYMGTARYRKTVEIPNDWNDRQIWLKIGGVRTEAYLWVNQKRVGRIDNFCGTYKYNITDCVEPGKPAEIVATVRNDSPSRKGQTSDAHRFGGFYRDVELEATPNLWIDDAWVASDFDRRAADVRLTLQTVGTPNELPESLQNGSIQIEIQTKDRKTVATSTQRFSASQAGREFALNVPIPDCRLWSPEEPNLYFAEIRLLDANGETVHGWTERFGIRKLEVVGDRFYLNGKPYFLRGYGDDFVYPETLVSPADQAEHLRRLQVVKESGFNFVRTHTHCEIPEFFEAADEAGVLVQAELPYYHDITVEAFEFDPLRDLQELYRHYRRYVSFAVYSLGNEGHLGSPLDQEIYRWVKTNDPARILQHQDGGCNLPENSDFDTPNSYQGPTSILPWSPGTFDYLNVPFVAHEYLNLSVKMDPRLESRFNGVLLPPRTIEDYEKSLADVGLDRAWGDGCLNAAHRLQAIYQKRGLEQAKLDPACDGYSFWTFVDVMVPQGKTVTGQGFLNAFYEPKPGGLTPKQFAEFNGPTTILANWNPSERIVVSGDAANVGLTISHFGFQDLPSGKIDWTIRTENDVLLEGSLKTPAISTGEVRALDEISLTVPKLEKPVRAEFVARLNGTEIVNRWNLWIFPQRTIPDLTGVVVSPAFLSWANERCRNVVAYGSLETKPTDALIVSRTEIALILQGIVEGRRILVANEPEASGNPNVALGWWSLGAQLGTTFARDKENGSNHPVFGDFPTDASIDELWFRLIRSGMLDLKSESELGEFEPLIVGEGFDTYYLYLGQTLLEDSRVLASFGLDLFSDQPESLALFDRFVEYIKSDQFQPRTRSTNGKTLLKKMARSREILTKLDGWGETIRATGFSYNGNYFCGPATIQVLRFQKGQNELEWKTKPIPEDFNGDSIVLSWLGGIGFVPNSPCELELRLNDETILTPTFDVADGTKTFEGKDGISLVYEPQWTDGRETTSFLFLTLPVSKLEPGKPLLLKWVGKPKEGSGDHWFGILEK